MLDEEHADAALDQVVRTTGGLASCVETAAGLVEQDHLGVGARARPSSTRRRVPVDSDPATTLRTDGEPDEIEDLLDLGDDGGVVGVAEVPRDRGRPGPVVGLDGHLEVLEHGHAREDLEALEGAAQAEGPGGASANDR